MTHKSHKPYGPYDPHEPQDLGHVPVDIDAVFKALSDPTRRSILETLGKKQYFCTIGGESVDGICVQDLSAVLNLPQSTISRHLAILRQAKLVRHQQKGIWHYYFHNRSTFQAVMRWLELFYADPGEHTAAGEEVDAKKQFDSQKPAESQERDG